MRIVDLPYLESVPKDELILGSGGVSVTSEAFAFGSTSYLFVSANSSATSGSDGDFTENATGVAGAFGDNAIATVTVAVDGNPVIEKTSSNLLQNTAVESGFVTVISLPSKLTFYDLWKNLF